MRDKRKLHLWLGVLLLGVAALVGGYCSWNQMAWAPLAAKYYNLVAAGTTDNTQEYTIYHSFEGMQHPYLGLLPWANDPDFKKVLAQNQAPVLMAAYKAVLPEPFKWEGENIALAASELAGTVVQPGETFSQNKTLGPYTRQKGYQEGPTFVGSTHTATVGGGVCKIASMLYNVVTFSDLPVVMRHHHSMTVPYVPPGQDATVCYGARDFRFLNDTASPVVIWCQRVDNVLYMGLYGGQKPPLVTWHHRVESTTPLEVQYRYNSQLAPGEEKVLMPGQDGYVVRSWVTLQGAGGGVEIKTKPASIYTASPRIIERGPKAP